MILYAGIALYVIIAFYTACRYSTWLAHKDSWSYRGRDFGEIFFYFFLGGEVIGLLWPLVAVYLIGRKQFNYLIDEVLFITPRQLELKREQKQEKKAQKQEIKAAKRREKTGNDRLKRLEEQNKVLEREVKKADEKLKKLLGETS